MGYGKRAAACALAALASLLGLALVATPGGGAAATTCPTLSSPGPDTTRILAAGDSLTQGSLGDWTWRYRVSKHLHGAGVDATFVGPFEVLYDNLTSDPDGTIDYADPCFDRQHGAIGGATYESFLTPPEWAPASSSGINWAVTNYHPDLVVVMLGFNDLNRGAAVDQVLDRAKRFVAEVRAANPHVSVVIADVPSTLLPDVIPDYNARLAAIGPTWSTPESPVVVAAARADWAGISDTWDGLHANAEGEMHLAAAIEDALHQLGVGPSATRPVPVVPLGPRVPPTLTGEAGAGAVTLHWVSPPGADREYLWYRDVDADGAWTPVPGGAGITAPGAVVSELEDGRRYAFLVHAAKGTAVAEDISSNVVVATPSSDPSSTTTPTPTSTPTPTPGVTATPVPTASPVPSTSLTPGSGTLGRVGQLTGTPDYHAVALHWTAVADATRYTVVWRPAGSDAVRSVDTAATDLTVSGLVGGQAYAFTVRPTRGTASGPYAPEIVVTPTGTVAPAPPRPIVAARHAHRIAVRWAPSYDATRYRVLIRRAGGRWATLTWTNGTRVTTPRLAARQRYAFKVQAWHDLVPGGTSPAGRVRVG